MPGASTIKEHINGNGSSEIDYVNSILTFKTDATVSSSSSFHFDLGHIYKLSWRHVIVWSRYPTWVIVTYFVGCMYTLLSTKRIGQRSEHITNQPQISTKPNLLRVVFVTTKYHDEIKSFYITIPVQQSGDVPQISL